VLFASTSEVFGKNPNPPFAEDDDRVLGSTRTARWSYRTSKAMAEHLVFAMHAAHALPVTVVRYFNVYGPRQNPIFVISQSIHRILNGHPPLVYDPGDQTRCFTYVDDAIAGTLLAAESSAAIGEAFNVGSMTETTVRDVVELAIKIAVPDLCGRRLLACPMSDHPDAKLAYFPRWAGCVARGNLPMGMWRDCSTPCGAADSRPASSYPQAQVPQHVRVWILTTSLVSGSHDLAWPIPQRVSLIGAC
jgi:nucleoside-diphosphate-sugar epimerase